MQRIRYGTYGFLSLMMSAQLALIPSALAGEKADRAMLDAKKSARTAKRKVNKTARGITGQGNTWKDMKEEVSDGAKNAKDELNHAAKKVKKGE